MAKFKKQESCQRWETDVVMRKLYMNLYSDFRPWLKSSNDIQSINLIGEDMTAFREHKFDPKRFYREVDTFKRSYQLENVFKRYRFSKDKFTTDELDEITFEKFLATQERLAQRRPWSHRARLVISAAAKHVRRILGNYDKNEHLALCRFGTRAAVGHPSTRRYLDLKAAGELTGSPEHIAWFQKVLGLQENYLLRDMLAESDPKKDLSSRFVVCDALNLVNVPKTFKSLRSILPNTLIGGFYSYGLGKVVQARLTGEGLNIRWLQRKHRQLVKAMSRNRRYVTADLSAASDSFYVELVMALVPREWWSAFNLGRISKIRYKGKTLNLESFMTMGIGFTFQLQTLLFYSLLRGIQDCLGKKGFVSVYGDDLIYPTDLHPYVKSIFTDIGFLLNEDKTFVEESFRESCGADAYCGFDVRPFQPEGQSQSLSKGRYVCFLYKTINGLLRRWKEFEIPKTLNFLYSEILSIDKLLFQVPPSFPDYSGVQTLTIRGQQYWSIPIWEVPEITGRYQNLCFPCYKQVAKTRPVKGMYIYYWDKLRSVSTSYAVDLFDPYDSSETLIWRPSIKLGGESINLAIAKRMSAHVATDRYNVVRQQSHAHAWSDGSMS